MKVWGVTGWKDAGKTTMVERLVGHFTSAGLRVATIKHAHVAFEIDQDGTDSHRHRLAGASEVLVSSPRRWALMHELTPDEPEADLPTLIARLSPADLVIVEGFKGDAHPKLEVHRTATGHPLIAPENPTVRAIATDAPSLDAPCPVLAIDDIPAIGGFIARELKL